jgi:hypothetical protein
MWLHSAYLRVEIAMASTAGPANRSLLAKAALVGTVVVGVVAAGFVVGALLDDDSGEPAASPPANGGTAGDRDNPLGSTTSAPPSGDATPITATPAPSSSTSLSCDAETDDCGDPPITEIALLPPKMVLVGATAEVRGFGSSVLFRHQSNKEPEDADISEVSAFDAVCGFTNPVVLDVSGPSEGVAVKLAPDGFTAGLRANQFNYVSIGVSGGIVAGGFSAGGEGRGNSQQWPIEGGSFQIDDVSYTEGGLLLGALDAFEFTATWSGTSIENYTAEESAGTVRFFCKFAIDRHD